MKTLEVNFLAISSVLSVEPVSITIISPAHETDSKQSLISVSLFLAIIIAVKFGFLISMILSQIFLNKNQLHPFFAIFSRLKVILNFPYIRRNDFLSWHISYQIKVYFL